MPKIYVDPFRMYVSETVQFGALLDQIELKSMDWPDRGEPRSRWGEYGSDWICIDNQNVHPRLGIVVGTAFRLRMDELALRGGAHGIQELNLKDEEGLGEHVAFLWDSNTNLLWMQRDRWRMAIGVFCAHVRERTQQAVVADAVYRADTIKRVKKLAEVRKFEFRILTGENLKGKKSGLLKYLTSIGEYGGATVEIRISPRRGKALDPSAVSAVQDMVMMIETEPDSVAKATVVGRESSDGGDVFLDLLRDRNEFAHEVPPARMRDPGKLMRAVKTVWETYKDQL